MDGVWESRGKRGGLGGGEIGRVCVWQGVSVGGGMRPIGFFYNGMATAAIDSLSGGHVLASEVRAGSNEVAVHEYEARG